MAGIKIVIAGVVSIGYPIRSIAAWGGLLKLSMLLAATGKNATILRISLRAGRSRLEA